MPALFQWKLAVRHGVPLGVGIVSGHPKLMEGMDIHTSPILHAARMENHLQLKTASGTIYNLPMKEWRPGAGENELPALDLLGLPSDFWKQCAQAREAASRAEKAELHSLMQPGTLFLRIVGTHILSALWNSPDAQIHDAFIRVHLGMFQDSYLVGCACGESSMMYHLDFRLFPMWHRLEPYHISQGLELLQIRNEGLADIAFGFSSKNIVCTAGMVVPIPVRSVVGRQIK